MSLEEHNEIAFACAICAEEIEDKPLGFTLFPLDNEEAWQQWFIHARCAKLIFAERVLAMDLREELAELLEE